MKFNFYLLILLPSLIFAQLKINEIMSSNASTIFDVDNDASDWIEIFNNSQTTVNLSNYNLSDSKKNLSMWNFPNYILEPQKTMMVFASGKDRKYSTKQWKTLITEGDEWSYFVGKSDPPSNWKTSDFISNWQKGNSGFGYGDNDDNTTIEKTVTLYIRKEFSVSSLTHVKDALLHLDFDDGFIAYLNGHEIARVNMGDSGFVAHYYHTASVNHEAKMYGGGKPEVFSFSNLIPYLNEYKNVIAIEGHNVSSTSSDMTLIPFLSLGYDEILFTPDEENPLLDLNTSILHTNFSISSQGEKLFISDLNSNIIDSVSTGEIPIDISKGRYPNGGENWSFYSSPTPGELNVKSTINGMSSPPLFSHEAGIYNQSFNLELNSNNINDEIRFTTDGSVPTKASNLYSNFLSISDDIVIKARTFSINKLPSTVITNSFIFNNNNHFPVMSISTDRSNFFDSDSGIYVKGPNAESAYPYFGANFWQKWERPIHIEFIEDDGELKFSQDAGVQIFGQWSRGNDMKSLAIFARKRYGKNSFDYELFPNREIESFSSFLLRDSGNDFESTMMRDAIMTTLTEKLNFEKMAYRPVIVYLNGEYWGIHNMRQKVNEDFLADKYNISPDDLNVLENTLSKVSGDPTNYINFQSWLGTADLSKEEDWNYVQSVIDIDCYMDYVISEIYCSNTDWPGNNIKYWQQASTNSKWRWILYDTDFGFGFLPPSDYTFNMLEFVTESNGPGWPNPPWSTLLIRRLLQNDEFKAKFIAKSNAYFNTVFSISTVNSTIDSIYNMIKPEMKKHLSRWNRSYNNWLSEVSKLKNFANARQGHIINHYHTFFNLSGSYNLLVSGNSEKGKIEIEDIELKKDLWQGVFFKNIPIHIAAKPKPGYKFSHWEGDISSNDKNIIVTRESGTSIKAVFESFGANSSIVINEINYNSDKVNFNTEDWIELFNNSDNEISLEGWKFRDADTTSQFIFPKGIKILPKDYLVLCKDTAQFKLFNKSSENILGDLSFGFKGSGESLLLFDNLNNLIDSVQYDDESPWPTAPDGNGATLELKNPALDNNVFQNWDSSFDHGTPGKKNSTFIVSIEDEIKTIPKNFELKNNYPNPFNPSTTISYSIPKESHIKLSIFNILGEKITELINENQPAGYYKINFDAKNLSSGIYIYTLQTAENIFSKKMVLLK